MEQARSRPAMSGIEMLSRVIGFDTTSHRPNLPLIDFARSWLDAHDVPYRLSFDPTGLKANIHATIGPVQAGGVAFSGHVDTVPVDGQTWTGDPYVLRRENGRLIGRGACDMKGFVSAMLAAVPDIKARRLTRPVHLFLTYDEEVGYHGARRLMEDVAASGLRPDGCVVGEASGMRPIIAQKGRMIVKVTVRGHMAHSSEAHRGINAVHAAAEAIAYLSADQRRLAVEGPFEDGFDPPYTLLQVTDVSCDPMPNTVPSTARFQFEWRNVPATDLKHEFTRFRDHVATVIAPRMRLPIHQAGFDYEVSLDLGSLSMSPDHKLARAACLVTGVDAAGKVSFCSEGSLFQPAGIPSMVCGPGFGPQTHRPDEWIDESQFVLCEAFIRGIVDRLAV